MEAKKEKKRIRRTNLQVENAISTAMDKLVEREGLLKITANMLMAEANIESPVFYNRYTSIDDLIYEYISDKDFWVAGKLPYKDINKEGPDLGWQYAKGSYPLTKVIFSFAPPLVKKPLLRSYFQSPDHIYISFL